MFSEHTLNGMRRYPEEGFHYDWLGVMAMYAFMMLAKAFTAEYFNGRWTYTSITGSGAKGNARKVILRRLHFAQEDSRPDPPPGQSPHAFPFHDDGQGHSPFSGPWAYNHLP